MRLRNRIVFVLVFSGLRFRQEGRLSPSSGYAWALRGAPREHDIPLEAIDAVCIGADEWSFVIRTATTEYALTMALHIGRRMWNYNRAENRAFVAAVERARQA